MTRTRTSSAIVWAALCLSAAIAALAQTATPDPGSGIKPSAQTPAASVSPAASASAGERRVWERMHRLSQIIGSDVRNREGQKIGDLKDLIIDNQGNVQLAVVSTGGFLGIGDRLHAVPWAALRAGTSGDRLLDMDRTQLHRVPGFTEGNWPDLSSEAWQAENRRQFGL
jgi:sporulation protein YlmC with PRC-barrel domain